MHAYWLAALRTRALFPQLRNDRLYESPKLNESNVDGDAEILCVNFARTLDNSAEGFDLLAWASSLGSVER